MIATPRMRRWVGILVVGVALGGIAGLRGARHRGARVDDAPDFAGPEESSRNSRQPRDVDARSSGTAGDGNARRTHNARRLPAGAPQSLAPVVAALSRHRFADAERSARALVASSEGSALGWARYELAEAVWAQGRLGEAQSLYVAFLRQHPDHRAAPNARAALQFIRGWPAAKAALAERRKS